jgi:small-conductance mechanosensitive channel
MAVREWLADHYRQWTAGLMSWDQTQRWLLAFGVFLGAAVVLRILRATLKRRAAARTEKRPSPWSGVLAELLQRTTVWFQLILAAYFGSLVLDLGTGWAQGARSIAVVALLIQGAIWGSVLLTFFISQHVRQRLESDAAGATTISMLGFLSKLVLWSLVLLLVLSNLGIDVTALITGLGIGGIAIALAAQNVLGDLFASLSIVLDKPFVLGDAIAVETMSGTVEHIGLKTTRVRSSSGEQLIFSNNDLLRSRVRNFKRMQERRVEFTLGVTYGTPLEKLRTLPALLRDIVQAQPRVRLDRAHFKSCGEFSLVFEVVYCMLEPDYSLYMDTQQAINLAIVEQFRQQEIEFAYPTRTIHLQASPAG